MSDLPPWLTPAWEKLWRERERLHHALLLQGPAGTGKLNFAESVARALLGDHSGPPDPDCQCAACLRLTSGSHPDLHVLASHNSLQADPERPAHRAALRYAVDPPRTASGGQWITIAQVRDLHEQFAGTPPQLARCRVALITPADALNPSAANALLKLLEEPPDNSFLLLVSARRDALPATIRSRCFELPLHPPPRPQAIEWLKQQGSPEAAQWLDLGLGPLTALQLQAAGSPGWAHSVTALTEALGGKLPAPELAERLAQMEFALLLRCLQRQMLDLLIWHLTGRTPEWFGTLRPRARLVAERGFKLYDRILFYTRLLGQPVNQRLAVDALCLELAGALVPVDRAPGR